MSSDLELCSICHSEMGEDCHVLACDHKYHTACIINWFRSDHNDCPLCRGMPNVKITIPSLMQRAHQMINTPTNDQSLLFLINDVKRLQEGLRSIKEEARSSLRSEREKYGPILQTIKQQRTAELQRHSREMAALDARSRSTNGKIKSLNASYNARIRIKARELHKAKQKLGFYNARPLVAQNNLNVTPNNNTNE